MTGIGKFYTPTILLTERGRVGNCCYLKEFSDSNGDDAHPSPHRYCMVDEIINP